MRIWWEWGEGLAQRLLTQPQWVRFVALEFFSIKLFHFSYIRSECVSRLGQRHWPECHKAKCWNANHLNTEWIALPDAECCRNFGDLALRWHREKDTSQEMIKEINDLIVTYNDQNNQSAKVAFNHCNCRSNISSKHIPFSSIIVIEAISHFVSLNNGLPSFEQNLKGRSNNNCSKISVRLPTKSPNRRSRKRFISSFTVSNKIPTRFRLFMTT